MSTSRHAPEAGIDPGKRSGYDADCYGRRDGSCRNRPGLMARLSGWPYPAICSPPAAQCWHRAPKPDWQATIHEESTGGIYLLYKDERYQRPALRALIDYPVEHLAR